MIPSPFSLARGVIGSWLILNAVLLRFAAGFQCYTCNNRPLEDDTQGCEDRLEECLEGVRACSSVVFRDVKGAIHRRKFCTASGTPLYLYLTNFPGSSLCQNIETDKDPRSPRPNDTLQSIKLSKASTPADTSVPDLEPIAPQSFELPPLNNELTSDDDFPPILLASKSLASPSGQNHSLRSLARRRFARAARKQFPRRSGPPSQVPTRFFGRRPASRVPQFSHSPSHSPQRPATSSYYVSTLVCVCTTSRCNEGDYPNTVDNILLQNIKKPASPPNDF